MRLALTCRLLLLLSLLAFVPVCAAASEHGGARGARYGRRCEPERKELRLKALRVLNIESDVNLLDNKERREITAKNCGDSMRSSWNQSQGIQGRCETTLNEILNTIHRSDEKIAEACETISTVSEMSSSCNQESCFRDMARQVREAAAKIEEARKLVESGAKKLSEAREQNETVAVTVATNLGEIAKIIEEYNAAADAARPPRPRLNTLHAKQQQLIIDEELKKRVGQSLRTLSGKPVSLDEFMAHNGIKHYDPTKIKARASTISKAAVDEKPFSGETNYEEQFGKYAGEQIQVKQFALQYEPVATHTREELGKRVTRMNDWATRLESKVPGSVDPKTGTVNPGTTATAPPPSVTSAVRAPASSPRESRLAGASRMLDAMKTGMELDAAAPPAPLRAPASRPGAQAMESPAPRASLPSASNTAALLPDAEEAAVTMEAETGQALPADSAVPALAAAEEGFSYSIPGDAPSAPAPKGEGGARRLAAAAAEAEISDSFAGTLSPAQNFPRMAAPVDPELPPADDSAAGAYADAQLAQLERGGRTLSPKLRSQLREKLKSGFSLRQRAAAAASARAKGNGKSEAVAGMIGEMRQNGTLPSDQHLLHRELLSLAGAETDAEIQRLVSELRDEDAGLGILGTHSLSLFDRVRLAHARRFK